MTWTVFPQGLRDSPNLFGKALSQNLLDLDLGPNGKISQYIDDLLTCSSDEKNAQQNVIQVLNFGQREDIKSPMLRHRWSRQRSHTLEFRLHMSPEDCPLIEYKESSSCPPLLQKQFRAFLGLTGYCRIWELNYDLIAQLLYKSLRGWDDSIPLISGTPQKKAEGILKQALTQAPSLRLPDPEKAFQLYVHEKEVITLGVLTQRLGPEPQPIAYLSKRLNPVDRLNPPCLQNIAAIVILIADSLKLYFEGKLTIFTSH